MTINQMTTKQSTTTKVTKTKKNKPPKPLPQTVEYGPRDKWSYLTHLFGAILAAFGTIYLFVSNFTLEVEGLGRLLTMTLFGFSMIALYTSSALYHYCPGPSEKIAKLRKLDHAMIYVLIAGTYTPVLYNGLEHPKSTLLLCIIWGLGIIGIVLKMFFINAPRWLSTSLYVIMGWAIAFDPKAITSLPFNFFMLILAGGISYTIGAVFYILKKPNFSPEFGFHEIFHCFILAGTIIQFIGVAYYL